MAELEFARVAAYIAAGVCMGLGTLGPALGLGFIGGKACESVGKRPESAGAIMKVMMMPLFFAEAVAVYALLISIILVLR